MIPIPNGWLSLRLRCVDFNLNRPFATDCYSTLNPTVETLGYCQCPSGTVFLMRRPSVRLLSCFPPITDGSEARQSPDWCRFVRPDMRQIFRQRRSN